MKNIYIILLCFLITGCQILPQIDWLKFGSNNPSTQTSLSSVAAIASSKAAADIVKKASEADKKIEETKKTLEADYNKFRLDLQKAYEERDKKYLDNSLKISDLNFGVYHVTQANKDTDINTTIAHLRSKEIMARSELLNDTQKNNIILEVEKEKNKTIDELYTKYKASIYLAVSQKAALDTAEALIIQKEKEKQTLREVNRLTIDNLEKEKQEQFEKIKKDTENQVIAAKESQRIEMLGYIIKALVVTGIIFLILAVLLKSSIFGAVSILSLGLAYVAATVPFWVITSVMGIIIVAVVFIDPKTGKISFMQKPISNPKDIADG